MAAKIDIARLQVNSAYLVLAANYKKSEHGIVLCPDNRCRCLIQGVSASTRNVGGGQVTVNAFFRLPSDAEKEGKGHKPSCRFSVQQTVTRLVARSREIRKFDENADPLLDGIPGHKAEFRLHILMELLPHLPFGCASDLENSTSAEQRRVGTKYVQSSRLLKAYLRMAKAVLSLLARVQDTPVLEEWINLLYDGQRIPWLDYFYDIQDHGRLYDFLSARNQYRRSDHGDSPVAMVVEPIPQEVGLGKFGKYRIACRRRVYTSSSFEDVALRSVIYTRDHELALKIMRQGTSLVCAVPTIQKLMPPNRPWLKLYADINLSVVNASQVCRYIPTSLSS